MSENTAGMTPYDFRLILLGLDEITPEVADKLYEAGLDDALIGHQNGAVFADFERDAESFEAAVLSALADIKRAGVGVTGVRLVHEDAVVSAAEIARRIGKTRQAVSLYIAGKRGPGGFPRPVSDNSGEPVYSWAEVAAWLESNDMLPAELAREANSRAAIDHALESKFLASTQPAVAALVGTV